MSAPHVSPGVPIPGGNRRGLAEFVRDFTVGFAKGVLLGFATSLALRVILGPRAAPQGDGAASG